MSFLKDYEIFSSGNRVPPTYHIWAGISAIANLLSGRVWVDQGQIIIHPNLYIMLVGDPSNGKSLAMSISRSIIQHFPDVVIAPDSITKQALTQFMSGEYDKNGTLRVPSPCRKNFFNGERLEEYCQVAIYSNEFVTLLGTEPMEMIKFFTDIWMQKGFVVKTKHQGTDVIVGPCINILGCLTPSITSGLIKSQVISGGFARRCIWVHSHASGTAVPRPTLTDVQKAARERLHERGEFLDKVCGKFSWTPESESWFDKWFYEKEAKMKALTDPALKHYYGSKDEMLLKVAMCVQLSERDDLTLSVGALTFALNLLDSIEHTFGKVFEGTGRNELAPILVRIADYIQNSLPKPVMVKQLRLAFFADASYEELSRIFYQLQETGKAKIFKQGQVEYITTPARALELARQSGLPVVETPRDVAEGPSPEQP